VAEGGEGVDVTLDGRGADAGEMAGEVLAAGGELGCTGGLSFSVGTAFGNAGVDLVDHGVPYGRERLGRLTTISVKGLPVAARPWLFGGSVLLSYTVIRIPYQFYGCVSRPECATLLTV